LYLQAFLSLWKSRNSIGIALRTEFDTYIFSDIVQGVNVRHNWKPFLCRLKATIYL